MAAAADVDTQRSGVGANSRDPDGEGSSRIHNPEETWRGAAKQCAETSINDKLKNLDSWVPHVDDAWIERCEEDAQDRNLASLSTVLSK
jgi:hypothetical protein